MEIIEIKDNKNNIIKKNNQLIAAKGQLSKTALKMLSMLISMIKSSDTTFQRYALNINDFKTEIGINANKSKLDFQENAEELMRNPFIVGEGKMFNWCSMVDWKSIEGYIVFDIHQDLKPYLLQLKKNFTQYNITNVLTLKGKYSIRLYELFIQKYNEYKHYNKDSKDITFELKIKDIKDILQIPKSYLYADIKKQVIEKSKKDFELYTNITFEYQEKKLSRKVDYLIITMKNNQKGSGNYLDNLKTFIEYIRKNYINKDIWKGQDMILSVSEDGKIYNKRTLKKYNKNDALIVWEKWYQLAKDNKLF